MIAGVNVSPTDSAKDDPTSKVPPLQKWSDIMALQWESDAVPRGASPLRYIFRAGIVNDNTRAMIGEAHKKILVNNVPTWPGTDFELTDNSSPRDTEAFYGLLGTYHAAAGGYMLAQHRAQFGAKRIQKIKVWSEDRSWNVFTDALTDFVPNMMMYVTDVPP